MEYTPRKNSTDSADTADTTNIEEIEFDNHLNNRINYEYLIKELTRAIESGADVSLDNTI